VLQWSGQYENMIRVHERLKMVIPVTLALIFVLLYMNTRSAFKASLVMLAVPFSAIGAIWLFYILGYNVSIAAWVGMIALMGLTPKPAFSCCCSLTVPRRREEEGAAAEPRGTRRGDRPRRREAGAPEDDDGAPQRSWAAADHVVDLGRRRRHEADRRPDDRGLVTSFILELLVYRGDLQVVEAAGNSSRQQRRRRSAAQNQKEAMKMRTIGEAVRAAAIVATVMLMALPGVSTAAEPGGMDGAGCQPLMRSRRRASEIQGAGTIWTWEKRSSPEKVGPWTARPG